MNRLDSIKNQARKAVMSALSGLFNIGLLGLFRAKNDGSNGLQSLVNKDVCILFGGNFAYYAHFSTNSFP